MAIGGIPVRPALGIPCDLHEPHGSLELSGRVESMSTDANDLISHGFLIASTDDPEKSDASALRKDSSNAWWA